MSWWKSLAKWAAEQALALGLKKAAETTKKRKPRKA